MATLESRLQEAAMEGSVEKLLELLQQEPLLLDRVFDGTVDPPLHVAALLGHTDFIDQIIQQKPRLARERDSNGSSPLHLAAAKGHLEIVRLLLRVEADMCLLGNAQGWNPLQLAAANGRVDALEELVGARPEAARTAVDHGGNALHLCVKNNQLEALKVLVHAIDDKDFLNAKDDSGCSILHLAVSYKQIETIRFLVNTNGTELNATNSNGWTPLDVLLQSNRDVNDLAIAVLLGAVAAPPPAGSQCSSCSGRSCCRNGRLMRQREALMVVASVMATMAFQAAVNPPGGIWDGAGKSTPHTVRFRCFIFSITFCFVFSIVELFLLIIDHPSNSSLFLGFLSFAMFFSIVAMAVAFGVAILCVT
ncbi:ankyrin repeat-containing protein BDA1-like [Momordica charantia]|uniref:Ankyrin repeat-containing protein BDA1-like n=1 Tax=Momordica charantia TaxID=3673 RepID=A0A6J1BV84_MOMCH|nr:ankyrin repeat-containing protein BDA1-like [Momordica charantia]